MSRKPVEDISKLPKWAQQRIQVLEMRVEEAQKRLEAYFNANDGDRKGLPVIVEPHATPPGKLRRGSTVVFKLEDNYDIHANGLEMRQADVDVDGKKVPCVEVRATGGSQALVFEPIAANCGRLRSRYW